MSIQAETPGGPSQGINVLHVDDEPEFLDLSVSFLESLNDDLSIQTATSADEGLARLGERRINCVISDYHMPDMNGLDLLDSVRRRLPNLPFILMTSVARDDLADTAIDAGATDFVEKRIGNAQFRILANRIENAVARHRMVGAISFEEIANDVRIGLLRTSSWKDGATAGCQTLCRTGPFDLAWIGHPSEDGVDIICASTDEQIDCRASTSWRITGGGPNGIIDHALETDVLQVTTVEPPELETLRSVAAIPLVHDDETAGILGVSVDEREISDAERILLDDISPDLASVAVRRER